MSDEAVFIYRDERPGRLEAVCAMDVGQHVVVEHNGRRVDLQNIMRFGDTGYVSRIELNRHKHTFFNHKDYEIDVIGAGPASQTYGYTNYIDETDDSYSLKLCDRNEKSHYTCYDSKRPKIKTITWEPASKIIDGGIASRWMTDNPKIRALTLDKVTMLGSHDAGMNKFQWGTAGGTKNNTITQVRTIGQQLNLGARYFDLRPFYRDGEFYCGHFSQLTEYIIGWQGACGQSFSEIIKEINDFCKDKKELIILNIGGSCLDVSNPVSFKDFDDDIWNRFYNKLNEINNICQSNGNLLCDNMANRKTIGELTAEKSAVVIIDPKGRFCKTDDLKISNSYSNEDDFEKMRQDQFEKMKEHANDPNQLFLISWTLTLQGAENINPFNSILELAEKANNHIDDILNQARNTAKYPNIVYIDKIGDQKGYEIAEQITALRNHF